MAPVSSDDERIRWTTSGTLPKDLDNNVNFSPDGRWLVFDCRDKQGIDGNSQLGLVDVATGAVSVFYRQPPGVLGVGAPSFLTNREVVAIHAIPGLTYDFTVRGDRILSIDDPQTSRWLDSRSVTPPFIPGALRGGTHKHEPDASGEWVGFTYNDHVTKQAGYPDLRNVGVSHRGIPVPVIDAPGNFTGESFSVLLTACVDRPRPGTDEYRRAEGDCWVGREGYPTSHGLQRARAFRGLVAGPDGDPQHYDVFTVDVPDDITVPGPTGPLQGTPASMPQPPTGALVRRLTHTADRDDPDLRGITGHLRASGNGRWIACMSRVRSRGYVSRQVLAVSATDGEMRQMGEVPGGVAGDPRFSPDSRFVVASATDGSVWRLDATEPHWGAVRRLAPTGSEPATNLVISPCSTLIALNRQLGGILQILLIDAV